MAKSTQLVFGRDKQGYPLGFIFPFPIDKYSVTLTASADTTLTVPGYSGVNSSGGNTQFEARIKVTGSPVWFAVDSTAAVPAGNTFASTTSVLIVNSDNYIVTPAQVLHFITSASNVQVSVEFYIVSQY